MKPNLVFKLANSINNVSTQKLDQGLSKLQSLQQNSLFNSATVEQQINQELAQLKVQINNYKMNKNPQMKQNIDTLMKKIQGSISYFEPSGLHENPTLLNQYQTVLNELYDQTV